MGSGIYDKKSCEFVCTNADCPRYEDVVSYGAFEAEMDRLTDEFFEEFPGLAHSDGWDEIESLAWQLLKTPMEPHRAYQLVLAWNEVFATPPMSKVLLFEIVDWVAGELRSVA